MSRRNKTKEEKISAFAEKSLGVKLDPWQLDLLANIMQSPDNVALVQTKSTKDEGLEVYHISLETHTMILDRRVIHKAAISKFVTTVLGSPHAGALSENARDALVAIAVAQFNVPLEDLYDNSDYDRLSDHALATIFRIRHDQENPA